MPGQLGLNFDICRSRHNGNEESEAAFDKNKESKEYQLFGILAFIKGRGDTGATADEVSEALGIYIQTASARCSELKARGFVEKRGTRKTKRGCSAGVLVYKNLAESKEDLCK